MEPHPLCCHSTTGWGEAALGSPVLVLWKPWECLHSQGRQAWHIPPAAPPWRNLQVFVPQAAVLCPALCHWCCHTECTQAPGGQCPLPTVKRPRNQPQTPECLQWINPPAPLFSVAGRGGLGWFFSPGRMWFILWWCSSGKKPSECTSCFHR